MRVTTEPRDASQWWRLLLGLTIAAVLGWLLLQDFDWVQLRVALADAAAGWLLTAVGLLSAGYACRIARWQLMLRARNPALGWRVCAGPFLASFALNNLLPLRAGDAVRVVGFTRQLGVPGGYVLGTVALERLLDLCVVAALFFAGVTSLPADRAPPGLTLMATWMLAAGLVLLIVLMACAPRLGAWSASFAARQTATRSGGWRSKLGESCSHLAESLASLAGVGVMIRILLLSFLAWCLEGAVLAAVIVSVGMSVHPAAPWFATASGTLATLLPGAPGHFGTFDYFTVFGLEAFGVETGRAVVVTLIAHCLLWLPITLCGLAWLLLDRQLRGRAYNTPGQSG